MTKRGGVYIIIAVIAIGFLLLIQYNKPKKLNWFPSFVAQHTIPYGTLVANELLSDDFGERVQQVYKPPFEYLKQNESIKGTYIIINNNINFGDTELNALLHWTAKGNSLFVASEGFEQQLLDTLNLGQSGFYNGNTITPVFYHVLANKRLQTKEVPFKKDFYTMTFDKLDTLKTKILGEVYQKNDSLETAEKKVTIVEQPFGKGTIILSHFPKAFTNYFILKDNNKDYTAGLFSYLNKEGDLYVDNHHKSGKSFYTSPMYIFLNTTEFKWAYYLVLIGALVYVVFEGKRKQRPIPVVKPLKNQTLAFTRTIGDMYFETGQQKEIATHKITNFLEYLRRKFYIGTENLNAVFYQNLASRSYHTPKEIASLFQYMQSLEQKANLTDTELQTLNQKIETFKAKANGK